MEDMINKILTDMIKSGELELGWNFNIKEFKLMRIHLNVLGHFKNLDDSIKCDIFYYEFGKEFTKVVFISKEVFDRYMIQNNRDNNINNLLDL